MPIGGLYSEILPTVYRVLFETRSGKEKDCKYQGTASVQQSQNIIPINDYAHFDLEMLP